MSKPKVKLNLTGLSEITNDKSDKKEDMLNNCKCNNINNSNDSKICITYAKPKPVGGYAYANEKLRLINSEFRLIKGLFPDTLYINDLEFRDFNGWIELFELFCGFCYNEDSELYKSLSSTNKEMGIYIAETISDLPTYQYTRKDLLKSYYDVAFNLDVRSKAIGVGTAIFRISNYFGFKCVAIEVVEFKDLISNSCYDLDYSKCDNRDF